MKCEWLMICWDGFMNLVNIWHAFSLEKITESGQKITCSCSNSSRILSRLSSSFSYSWKKEGLFLALLDLSLASRLILGFSEKEGSSSSLQESEPEPSLPVEFQKKKSLKTESRIALCVLTRKIALNFSQQKRDNCPRFKNFCNSGEYTFGQNPICQFLQY